ATPPDLSPPSDRPAPLRRLVNRRAVLAAAATAGAAGAAGLLIPPWLRQQPHNAVLSSPPTGLHTTSPAVGGSTATRNAPKSSPHAKNFIPDLYVSALAIGWLGDTAIAVTGNADNTVRIWNLTTLEQHGETMKGTPDPDPEDGQGSIYAVAVGRLDGKTIAVSGGAEDIVVWDLETCRRYGRTLTGIGRVTLVSLAKLGERTFAVSNHGRGTSVVIWDLETRDQYGQLDGLAGTSHATSLTVGQLGGRTIIAASAEGEDPLMWDLESGQRHGKPLKGHTDTVISMAIGQLDDKAIAVSGSLDGTVRVWDLESGQQRGNPLKGHSGGVHWVAIGRLHGKSIAVSVDRHNAMRVWDLESGRPHGKTIQGRLPIHLSAALGRLGDRTVVLSSEWEGNEGQTMTRLWDLGPA
ncbi:MAG: WD40 repeat domain-containing protein, partial [Hamadaea sp.]|nr:WD40 repeat domain-containing protein [Hamadaea sp.]